MFKKLDRCEIQYDGEKFFIQKWKNGKNGKIKAGIHIFVILQCKECNKEFFANKREGRELTKFCSCSCMRTNYFKNATKEQLKERSKNISKACKGRTPHNFLNGFASYEYYYNKLFSEEIRQDLENAKILNVKCRYCGKWFRPTTGQACGRYKGQDQDYGRLYCSNECKKECPIYNKIQYPKGFFGEDDSSREVYAELRKLVFERDNYTCQKCEQIGGVLHCHHIKPQKISPIENADVDNCLTLCKKCHNDVHKQNGCYYGQLANCINV